jgi:hypothetical protein
MSPDPEPGDLVVFYKSDRPIGETDPHGVDRFSIMDLLELEAGVLGGVAEELVGRHSTVRC